MTMTYQVDIINPKAKKLLQALADLELISMKQNSDDNFQNLIDGLRTKASGNRPSLKEIPKR
jgi:hypothetical protein